MLIRKNSFLLGLFILLVSPIFSQSQVAVDFCLTPITPPPYTAGESVEIALKSTNLYQATDFEIPIEYLSTQLEYVSVNSAIATISISELSPGQLHASGAYNNGGVLDNDDLAILSFIVTEDTDEFAISLSNDPNPLEVSSTGGQSPVTECGAYFAGPQAYVDLSHNEISQAQVPGHIVYVNLNVLHNFSEVTSFNLQVTYNAGQFEFLDPSSPNFEDISVELIHPGLIQLSWSGDATTLALFEALITLPFEATTDFPVLNFNILTSPEASWMEVSNGNTIFFNYSGFELIPNLCPSPPIGPHIANTTVEVPIIVSNFTVAEYMSIPLNFPDTNFELSAINPHPALSSGTFVSTDVEGGSIIQYLGRDIPDEISDGDTLFSILLNVLDDSDELLTTIAPDLGSVIISVDAGLTNIIPITICGVYNTAGFPANVRTTIEEDVFLSCIGTGNSSDLIYWNVKFESLSTEIVYYSITSTEGSSFTLLPSGTYLQSISSPGNPDLWSTCESIMVDVPSSTNTMNINRLVNIAIDCPDLFVNVSSSNFRPCFSNNRIEIDYGNVGTEMASNTYINIFIDPNYQITVSNTPFTDLGNGQYRFNIGDLPPNEFGTIILEGIIICELPVGKSICIEATIFPRPIGCSQPDPAFEGAELNVTSECDGDSIRFNIQNIGDGPSGQLEYHVIEDVIIYLDGTIEVAAGENVQLAFAAEGTTFRLEIDRPNAAPYLTQPLGIEEGCGTLPGGGISTGFVNAYSLLDDDPWFDRYCQETSAAFDPNDKQAIPSGIGPNNDIFPNQTMDYKIRFQNTGTDTAFNITIRDLIDTTVLDISTLQAGASSHPYRVMVIENELIFTFENILLPDSTTNLVGSNGYVHFTMAQQPDLPDGTSLENTAAIYFDFNEPIITNTSQQTINRNLLTKVVHFSSQSEAIPVYPSPTSGLLFFDLSDQQQPKTVVVYDMFGREVAQRHLAAAGNGSLDLSNLPSGRYAYRLSDSGQLIQTGVVVVR